MEEDQKVRRTLPAILDGQPVRLVVAPHTPEERPTIIERIQRQRQDTPTRGVFVIVRGLPIQVVDICKIEIIT